MALPRKWSNVINDHDLSTMFHLGSCFFFHGHFMSLPTHRMLPKVPCTWTFGKRSAILGATSLELKTCAFVPARTMMTMVTPRGIPGMAIQLSTSKNNLCNDSLRIFPGHRWHQAAMQLAHPSTWPPSLRSVPLNTCGWSKTSACCIFILPAPSIFGLYSKDIRKK